MIISARETGRETHLDLPDLYLQGGEVLEDLQVLGLVLEGVEVALDRLGVVALRPVKQAIHVPAHMTVVSRHGRVVVDGGDCAHVGVDHDHEIMVSRPAGGVKSKKAKRAKKGKGSCNNRDEYPGIVGVRDQ